jgi:cytochrome-b5 reductase
VPLGECACTRGQRRSNVKKAIIGLPLGEGHKEFTATQKQIGLDRMNASRVAAHLWLHVPIGGSTMRRRFVHSACASAPRLVATPEFLRYQLTSIASYNHNTTALRLVVMPAHRLRLQHAASNISPPFHFTLRLLLNDGSFESRQYTPVFCDAQSGELQFLIKRYDDGVLTPLIHAQFTTGTVVELQGPLPGAFAYASHGGSLALFAAGTGVTPIIQIAQAAMRDPHNVQPCYVYCAHKTHDDILCRAELRSLVQLFEERLRVCYLVEAGEAPAGGYTGRISAEVLAATLRRPEPTDQAIVCGAPLFNSAMLRILRQHGYAEEQIKVC